MRNKITELNNIENYTKKEDVLLQISEHKVQMKIEISKEKRFKRK